MPSLEPSEIVRAPRVTRDDDGSVATSDNSPAIFDDDKNISRWVIDHSVHPT
jgi:hypothetical protein